VIELMKDSMVVRFFSKIGWSFKKLYDLLKRGYHAYRDLRKVMAEYLASTKVGRWTTDELKKLDEFFSQHPTVRRITGIALAGLLVFLWFHEAFIGDPDYDFDVSDIFSALAGSYSFSKIFGGPDGAMLLTSLLIGTAVSFPWPGPGTAYFIGSIVTTLAKKLRLRFRKERPEKDEKVPALAV
jgi:succinate dehydrogenase hydrophobic anchor subunit